MKKQLLFILFTTVALSTVAQIPTNGLVGWFPFSNSVADETGNSANLVFNGTATYVNDRNGNANSALMFEEISNEGIYSLSWVSGENTAFPIGSEPRTIAGWYHSTAIPNLSHTAIVSWGAGSTDPGTMGQASALFASKNGDQLFFWSAWNDVGQTTSFGATQWYHFAATYDGFTSIKFYKDGVLIGTQTLSDTLNTISNNGIFFIGRSTHQNDQGEFDGYFNGALDDIGVWNRVLTATEIEQVFEATTSSTASVTEVENNQVSIYPNPAQELIHFIPNTATSVSIRSLDGTVVYSEQINAPTAIKIDQLASGVYVVQTADGQILRFIKY